MTGDCLIFNSLLFISIALTTAISVILLWDCAIAIEKQNSAGQPSALRKPPLNECDEEQPEGKEA